jgi:branched-chain amino acid transport system permease protein
MIEQLLDIVTTFATLFVVAMGLFVVFGVMRVINLAHGAFLVIGAYSSLVTSKLGWTPWLAFALAPLVGLCIGAVIERLLVRRLYNRPLDTILATWGLSIVIVQAVTLQFGRGAQFSNSPLRGFIEFGEITYSKYRLFVVLVCVLLWGGIYLVTRFTDAGLTARAVVMNENLARAMGINTDRVRLVTFSLGSAFAAFAGAVLAPMLSIDPNMGLPFLVPAFMLVLVAGPTLSGLALSALILGGSQTVVGFYANQILGNLVVVVLAVVLIRFFPMGLSLRTLRSR